MEKPPFLKSGEIARLFPVISESGKEQRAASIFLSVISAVPPLSSEILAQLGQRVGARTIINTYTEIVFNNEDPSIKRDRPDGLVELVSGKKRWCAILEAKIGKNPLSEEQLERYLRLARENSVDAVITISNEFTALPEHHPINVNKQLTRRVQLFHFSWTSILTTAILLQERAAISDPEQAFLLREFIRFFSHPSAGLSSFDSMPRVWPEAIQLVQAGGRLTKREHAEPIVRAWHQELRDLTLRMSRTIGCEISAKLSRAHQADADKRFRDDVDDLCSDGKLTATLGIPDAASDLILTADLKSRSLRASMNLLAPKDRKTNRARINWLLRQVPTEFEENVSISCIWSSRAADYVTSIAKLRANLDHIEEASTNSEIRAFEIILNAGNAQRFTGRRTVVEELERLAPFFYERVGQHLKQWVPSPPKPKHSIDEGKEPETPAHRTTSPIAGNAHSDLLEIPGFLLARSNEPFDGNSSGS